MSGDLSVSGDLPVSHMSAGAHSCPEPAVFLPPPPGAAGGGVPDAAAAETEGAAAPHADRSARLQPQLAHDHPVAQPAVVSHSLAPAGRPGKRPLRPAGQRTSQARGE